MSKVVTEHLRKPKSEAARRIEREFKVPTDGSLWPSVYWIACVTVPDGNDPIKGMGYLYPSDDEVRQIRSYIEYKTLKVYNETYQRKVMDAELPVCAGHNTTIFVKYPEVPDEGKIATARGWGYRQMTWQTGSWPHSYGLQPAENFPDHPLTVVEVMDHVESFGGDKPIAKWVEWKESHPDVF